MVAKVFAVFFLGYGVACFVFNFLGLIVNVIPNLGSLGSWLFNPLGMAFGGYITGQLVGGNPLLWLGSDGVAWAVGGIIGVLWTFGLMGLGVWLLKR